VVIDKPTILFVGTSLVVAIVVGAMLVSGWRAGSLDNDIEWLFWAGAVFGAAGVACFGFAAMGDASAARLTRAGILLFMSAPVLCVAAVMIDYWI